MMKSAHFIPVKVSYTAKDYAKLYLREMEDTLSMADGNGGKLVAANLEGEQDLKLTTLCVGDLTSIDSLEELEVDESLSYEEVSVEILNRQVTQLRNKEVSSVKVLWRNHLVEGATWEAKADMKSRYPQLFPSTLA
ncbi:hypothetical protein MTR67_002150 [Solanum verrucosum]|uniref:Uncharacterized protein n=1 Tax=Solanum verrucosum TaxID=315347 RepID=A0AAF0PRU9_SOLVR|nr:hypothetical protein MTR67_002150 [Solanum verrucosum]